MELLSMERQNNSSPMLIRKGYFAFLWTSLEYWTPLKSLFYACNESVKLTSEFKRDKPIGYVRPFPQKMQRISRGWHKGCTKGRPCLVHPSSSPPKLNWGQLYFHSHLPSSSPELGNNPRCSDHTRPLNLRKISVIVHQLGWAQNSYQVRYCTRLPSQPDNITPGLIVLLRPGLQSASLQNIHGLFYICFA